MLIKRSTQNRYIYCPIEEVSVGHYKVTCIKFGTEKYFKLKNEGNILRNANVTFHIK